MNGNDLMDALSGLDPKYIDEAALELHKKPVQLRVKKNNGIRRGIFIALPAAAAIILTFAFALPALIRLSGTHNTGASETAQVPSMEEAASSDTADYAPAQEAASPDMADVSPMGDSAADSAMYDDAEAPFEASGTVSETKGSESAEAQISSPAEEAADMQTDTQAVSASMIGLTDAVYDNGILTLTTTGTVPEDLGEKKFTITAADGNGADITVLEGTLRDIIIAEDPLTLDLSDLNPVEGTYMLTIEGESIEFVI